MTVKKQPAANTGAAGLQTELSHRSDSKIQLSQLLYCLKRTKSYRGYWNGYYFFLKRIKKSSRFKWLLNHAAGNGYIRGPISRYPLTVPHAYNCLPAVTLDIEFPVKIGEKCTKNNECKGHQRVLEELRHCINNPNHSAQLVYGTHCRQVVQSQKYVYSCLVLQL